MSLDFLTRPIGGSKKASPEADDASTARRRPVHPETVDRPGGAEIVVGGSPRVDLMPPEIRVKRSQLRTRRRLRLVLVAVVVVTLAACGGAFGWNTVTQASLVLAQAQQQQLLGQQQQFGKVTTVSNQIALIEAGQRVGSSTEIQWGPYLDQIAATLPAGVSLTTLSVDSASPVSVFQQPTAPLQGGRIATVTFQMTSGSIPPIADILDSLSKIPGFVDATPTDVTGAPGTYTASITMHIGTAALSNRFTKAGQ